ncbi:MAG: DUF3574 domain-containing protein [Luteimonas sp.]
MDRLRPALALATAVALGGCVHAGALRCGAGTQAMVQERLYFGTERPRGGGSVSDAEWTAFLDDVAAAFPDGFTSWEAAGGWRGPDGRAVREASHVVEIVHQADAAADARIEALGAAYAARFDQDAVMRVRLPACVAFQTR